MIVTPQSNRLHVCIFGETNSGKSALFNALIESDVSIVSDISGTTTDFVQKSMELLPFGPIVLVDTAGLNDNTILGEKRLEKTEKLLDRTDFAIYTVDANKINESTKEYEEFKQKLDSKNIPHLLVFTKSDIILEKTLQNGTYISIFDEESIKKLKEIISNKLLEIKKDSDSMIGDLLSPKSTVLMVVPIDSSAPKGRLILPQVQLIRDCLDNSITCYVTTEKELSEALENIKKIDLVVTDSQVFKLVADIVPKSVKLTSFSILMARQKGDIDILLNGIDAIKHLKDGDKVLIAETCTHNRTHEDIGHVKIPNALKKTTGCNLEFDFSHGRDYPENLEQYTLIIHCGGCMITEREFKSRISYAKNANIPITNYGLVLAHCSGILERSVEILKESRELNA